MKERWKISGKERERTIKYRVIQIKNGRAFDDYGSEKEAIKRQKELGRGMDLIQILIDFPIFRIEKNKDDL